MKCNHFAGNVVGHGISSLNNSSGHSAQKENAINNKRGKNHSEIQYICFFHFACNDPGREW